MLPSIQPCKRTKWVRPEIGSGGDGHTFPGAAYPFGLVQPSPDTGREGYRYCAGYRYEDDRILGFSQTHLSGTGCGDLGDIRLMPFAGEASPGVSSVFRKETQTCQPGYYAVTLDDCDVCVEITAAAHTAVYRFTGAGLKAMNLLLDCQWGIGGKDLAKTILASDVRVAGKRIVSGTNVRKHWVERRYSFVIEFSREFAKAVTLEPLSANEKAPRMALSFVEDGGEPLVVKIGYSLVDEEGAGRNMDAECPGFDFDAVRAAAESEWERQLSRMDADGTDDEKTNFYSALYRLLIQPANIADVDGRYRGADGEVHVASGGAYYSTLSLWDTFRAAHPLHTLISAEMGDGFIETMLEHQKAAGFLPIWPLMGRDNQCMIGTHSVPVIVDWFLKTEAISRPAAPGDADALSRHSRDRAFWETAFAAIKDSLTHLHKGRILEDWPALDKYGYYPNDIVTSESVSRLLECCYDDWCAARMAERLGFAEDAAFFRNRSRNWRHVVDPETHFVRGRDTGGNWTTPFNPLALGRNAGTGSDFTEGNAWQWTWHVLHEPEAIVEAVGGREVAGERLCRLFTLEADESETGTCDDVTGLMGQYCHGNEPSHHVLYLLRYAGREARQAELIRDVFEKFYVNRPDGLCGNDDCGQMSAWYLFSAMGFYPMNPASGEYVLGVPQLPKIMLHLSPFGCRAPGSQDRTFTVLAKNLSDQNKYVKSVSLNGVPLEGFKIRHEDILKGGELVFEMTEGRELVARSQPSALRTGMERISSYPSTT
ncbi:MAG: GH92 family glycosyl hydrolase [Kiritimatiellae bacterium]|nr:GH92 family glycosyl hydrolase [Kiritimatiellia bacterium]